MRAYRHLTSSIDTLDCSNATLIDSPGAYVMTVNDSTHLDGSLLDQVYILKTIS